ncbi:MAG: hypothetical protein Q4E89_10960, partial [Eubacteriales bacterium]|nr:hypothetical protein [Eubacteriales bacterium]
MEKCKKLLFCLWVSIAALFLTALPTHAAKNITDAKTDSLTDVRQAECPSGSWVQAENGFQFRLSTTGEILTDKWIQVDGKIYYLNSSGLRAAGWIRYRENLYYMQPNGAMYTGWLTFENVKYHFDKSGKMKTSCWIQTGKYKYYVNAAGELQTSRWIQIGKHKYYVNRIGRLQT